MLVAWFSSILVIVLTDVLAWLRCPRCAGCLDLAAGSVRCQAGHSFDVARQGYVSLLQAGARAGGDTAAMVRARSDFLAAGHFAPLATALADAAASALARSDPGRPPGCIVDVGAGTGYYLAAVLGRLSSHCGLALDASRYALRQAARAHARIGAVGCDVWRPLPVAEASADLALNVFAPRDGAELRRILRPAGSLLVLTPGADHLAELAGPLGLLSVDERKRARLADKLGPSFDLVAEHAHRGVMTLRRPAAEALAMMGPSAWHTDQAALAERVARLPDPIPVTWAVTLTSLRPRP